MSVGVIGHGYVGQAVASFFSKAFSVKIYDKAKELNSLEEVVAESSLIFVCVPTPMNPDGSCHTDIVESVLEDISNTVTKLEKNLDSFIVVIKSTVYPGFTNKMLERHRGMKILFSPEFLTERNSTEDFEKANRIIMGGNEQDAEIAFGFFRTARGNATHDTLFVQCDNPTSAEMTKLYTNGFLATKVLFSNEIYQVCQRLGIDYSDVRQMAAMDPRVGESHMQVPGLDGSIGYGGACFAKDLNNLAHVCKKLEIPEKLITAVIERNNELRPEKDWEQLKGRAVVETTK